MTNPFLLSDDWILLFGRVILAIVMVYYGWPKIKKFRTNAEDFVEMGFKPGMFWGTLVALVEFVGGIGILLGFSVELAAALFGFQMIVGTFWKLKLRKSFPDYSYDLQLLALCVVLMAFGPGRHSLTDFRPLRFLRWDVVAISILVGAFLAFLPEIFGERYRQWGKKSLAQST